MADVTISEPWFPAQVDLRVAASEAGPRVHLPLEPNTWFGGPQARLKDTRSPGTGLWEWLWLGPDEWLGVCPMDWISEVVQEVMQFLEGALDGWHRSIIDVSAGRAVIELGGDGRHELLSHGCGLDLHPRSWRAGLCAQTLLARVPVILQERDGATRVFVRPSFAEWLRGWLVERAADLS